MPGVSYALCVNFVLVDINSDKQQVLQSILENFTFVCAVLVASNSFSGNRHEEAVGEEVRGETGG